MSLDSWLHSRRPRSLQAATHRLHLEPLEDRHLLAFLAPVDYAVGAIPSAIATADFNNDSALDLAIANQVGDTISFLPGNGDGTFDSALTSAAGSIPQSLAVGDFDNDGNLDLATANVNEVSVLMGDGEGHFTRAHGSGISVGSYPASVAVGDFNGDGLLDLGVTANTYYPQSRGYYDYYPGYNTSSIHVLLGNGLGDFSAPRSTNLGISYYGYYVSALAADLNGDIYADFVTFHTEGYVGVLHGGASGYLQPYSGYYTGGTSYALAAGDLDGDGDNDLVAPDYYGDSISLLRGRGDGSGGFSEATYYAVGDYPSSSVLADFTGDGSLDIASAHHLQTVSVLYNAGDGAFSSPVLFSTGLQPWAITAGDFNGDGWIDAATANRSDTVSVLINDRSWPQPPPSVSINDVFVTEGNTGSTNATFTLTLSYPYDAPVTVDYETADGDATAGSDYTATSGSVTFAAGVTSMNVAVPILGDRVGEADEIFFVNLSSSDASLGDSQAMAIIFDNEPRISIADASVTEGNSGTTVLSFIVTLSASYDAVVTVRFDTQDGSATTGNNDYVAASGTLTFAPGSTSQPINVMVQGDLFVEPDETFVVNLSDPSGALVADGQAIGVILTDDATKFYVVDASSDMTFEYGATGQSVESYSLAWGNNDPRGAASDASGQRVWVIDNDDYVDVYNGAGNSLGYWYAKGLKTPEGIASNGTDIWIVDRGSDRVYRYSGAASRSSGSASPTSSFALASGNREAKGIETDGTHLWVVNDASTNKVFKYTLSGALVGSWTISGTNTTPTGITLDPSNPSDIWIVDAGRDQVFQYTAAASRTSGSQSPSAVFNLASGNKNPQGIADPPPPGDQAASLITSASNADLRSAVAPQSPARAVTTRPSERLH